MGVVRISAAGFTQALWTILLSFFPLFCVVLHVHAPPISLHRSPAFPLPTMVEHEPLTRCACFVNSDHREEYRNVDIFTLKTETM